MGRSVTEIAPKEQGERDMLDSIFRSVLLLFLMLFIGLFMVLGCDPKPDPMETASYTMTMQVEGQGTVVPTVGSHEYDEDTVVNLVATPAEDWEFKEWIGDVADIESAETTVLMNENKTVKALFEEIPTTYYRLTIDLQGEGDVIEDPVQGDKGYKEDTVVTLTATPAEDWEFKEWIGDVADIESAETTVLMNENKTVKAVFEREDDPGNGEEDFAGGRGTREDPYLVANPMQLNNVRNYLDKHFLQIADIDLGDYNEEEGWEPIGDKDNAFRGTFDGNDYKITHLFIDRPETNDVGLFGYLGDNATIKKVALETVNVSGNNYLGGLVGVNDKGSIMDSYVTGHIIGVHRVGGLVGVNQRGSITNSYSTGHVTGDSVGGLVGFNDYGNMEDSYAFGDVNGKSVGGLVGINYYGSITNSYATGLVTGEEDVSSSGVGGLVGLNNRGSITNSYATSHVVGYIRVGGLVGSNQGSITNSYAAGSVVGQGSIGGLVGYNDAGLGVGNGSISNSYATGHVVGHGSFIGGLVGNNYYGSIKNSYATGHATGNHHVGGLAGTNNRGSIKNSYATGLVTGNHTVGGLVGDKIIGSIIESYYDKDTTGQSDTGKGIPKTTTQMTQESTFEEWDFDSIWDMDEGNSYPYLQWQEPGTYPYP